MSNTRTSTSPGVFAADAATAIPPTPTLGVAYRDPTTTQSESRAGWPYGTKVDSATFNQILHEATALLKIIDTQGILGWSNAVEYAAGNAYVLGSDGVLYQSTAASGPSTAPQDPTTATGYWRPFGGAAATSAEVAAGVVADKFVSPATLLAGLLGAGVLGPAGYIAIPFNLGGTLRRLIVQWGGGNSGGGSFISFPISFPNALLRLVGSDANGANIFGSSGRSINGFTLQTSASVLTFDYIAIGY